MKLFILYLGFFLSTNQMLLKRFYLTLNLLISLVLVLVLMLPVRDQNEKMVSAKIWLIE
jgi:hypothetical protein